MAVKLVAVKPALVRCPTVTIEQALDKTNADTTTKKDDYAEIEDSFADLVTTITKRYDDGFWYRFIAGATTVGIGAASKNQHIIHAGTKIIQGYSKPQ